MFTPPSPITGAAITGLTSPTYTPTADNQPAPNGKQFFVSALGGTQPGVLVHGISSPFTLSAFRPSSFKMLGQPSPAGVIRSFPKNNFDFLIRKAVAVAANQPMQIMPIRVQIGIPAGADVYDAINVKAGISCAAGLIYALAQEIYNSLVTGTL